MTGGAETSIQIAQEPAWAIGHFPGDPILPGAKLLDHVLHALTDAGALQSPACQVAQSKFSAPVRPGETIRLTWKTTGNRLQFVCQVGGTTVASGQITGMGPAASSDKP